MAQGTFRLHWIVGIPIEEQSPLINLIQGLFLCVRSNNHFYPETARQIYIAFYVADITSCTRYLYYGVLW
jgi:hypothetical protein